MAMTKLTLTEAEQQRIREAVQQAEAKTSGEIVPFMVQQSDNYEIALWRGAAIGGLKGYIICWLLMWLLGDSWALGWLYKPLGVASVMIVFGLLGFLVAYFMAMPKRFLAGYWELNKRTHQRAVDAFLGEEVFNTRDRTGILLFISFFERRIEVLGDSGIYAKVTQEEWADVVKHIRKAIKNNEFANGLVEAIGMCGDLLAHKDVAIKPDDKNELSDDIRIREK
jgi:putative membrane protein